VNILLNYYVNDDVDDYDGDDAAAADDDNDDNNNKAVYVLSTFGIFNSCYVIITNVSRRNDKFKRMSKSKDYLVTNG
jgi:hypothetical protein